MIPFPSNQKLITCWATNVSRECNWIITPTSGFFQIKIENIYLFKIIIIKEHGNVFKTWLCPNFLLLPKKSELPKIWGGCSPPRPPGPYAYAQQNHEVLHWHFPFFHKGPYDTTTATTTGTLKKAIGLMNKTTTLHVHHAFFVHFFAVLNYYDVKWPKFKFTWERERQGDKFYHLCLSSGAVPSLQLQSKFTSF